jgi:hypothetical protein
VVQVQEADAEQRGICAARHYDALRFSSASGRHERNLFRFEATKAGIHFEITTARDRRVAWCNVHDVAHRGFCRPPRREQGARAVADEVGPGENQRDDDKHERAKDCRAALELPPLDATAALHGAKACQRCGDDSVRQRFRLRRANGMRITLFYRAHHGRVESGLVFLEVQRHSLIGNPPDEWPHEEQNSYAQNCDVCDNPRDENRLRSEAQSLHAE